MDVSYVFTISDMASGFMLDQHSTPLNESLRRIFSLEIEKL